MISNYHTHTTFCDGKNTPEEIVLYALEIGCSSIGFSGHGYTPFDLRYCMQNTQGYISEITRLKEKYGEKIDIYCGVEEDAFSYVSRESFDYIIGSSHYFNINDNYYPIDSNYDYFKKCLEVFNYDVIKMSEAYYKTFVDYIKNINPDIVGHFDVITKFDEIDMQRFLNNSEYLCIAEKYIKIAAQSDVIFEVNTGAMSRGIRKTPYLGANLLHTLKNQGGKVILSSDCHSVEMLNYCFDEMEYFLRDVGFNCVYELDKGKFRKRYI